MSNTEKKGIIIILCILLTIFLFYLQSQENSTIQWKSIYIQLIFDLALILTFTIIFSEVTGKLSELKSLHQQISNSALDVNGNRDQLIGMTVEYFKKGGENEIFLRGMEFMDFQVFNCNNFRLKTHNCVFNGKFENEDPNFVFFNRIVGTTFTNDLISNKFYNYSFENCSFTKHNYGLIFMNCNFVNVKFEGCEVVENLFNLDFSSKNMSFYNSIINSSRFISHLDYSDSTFNHDKMDESIYLAELSTKKIDKKEWLKVLSFNSKTVLYNVSMSFDIFLSIYYENKNLIHGLIILPIGGKVIINPTNSNKDFKIYTLQEILKCLSNE